jgi:iron complex transport system permease protein
LSGELTASDDTRVIAQGLWDRRRRRILTALGIGLAALFLISLLIGRYPTLSMVSGGRIFSDELSRNLILDLRLPRVLAAALLGMSLAAAGMTFQTIFANPLVEPGFLGVSQGAAFGAALCIIGLGNSGWMMQGTAAFFALIGLGASYWLARRIRYGGWVLRLVMAGIAVSALFSAGLGILKYIADPLRQLPEITFWLLGGLAGTTWPRTLSILPLVLLGAGGMLAMRWRLNLLSLPAETAFSLGLAVRRERLLLLLASVMATAAVISVAGIVGWVGLIIPHIARRVFGADTRYALPGALLMGGLFTLLCDDMARLMFSGEIPLGIVTSLIGALAFLVLMMQRSISAQRGEAK